jgi:hypothetical protein
MDKRKPVAATLALLFLGIVLFSSDIASAGNDSQPQDLKAMVSMLQDSLKDLQQQLDQLKLQAPGLGEYMTTIQLHASKLWFAAGASNWDLASYELDELSETMDGARSLHAFRNGLDIAGVLQSLQETQLVMMRQAVAAKSGAAFSSAYSQTLDACNGCHRSAGYGFISIMTPTAPPVTNQRWDAH